MRPFVTHWFTRPCVTGGVTGGVAGRSMLASIASGGGGAAKIVLRLIIHHEPSIISGGDGSVQNPRGSGLCRLHFYAGSLKFTAMSWAKLLVCLLVGLGAAMGCVARPEPAPPPLAPPGSALTRVAHFWGTPLSGPQAPNSRAFTAAQTLAVEVDFVALQTPPAGLEPLGSKARLIVAGRAAQPVLPTAPLTRLAGYAQGWPKLKSADQPADPISQSTGIVAEGTTARFEVADADRPPLSLPGGNGRRRFAIEVCQQAPAQRPPTTIPAVDELIPSTEPTTEPSTAPASRPAIAPPGRVTIQIAVALDDYAKEPTDAAADVDNAAAAPAPGESTLRYEMVLLDPIEVNLATLKSGRRMGLTVVAPFALRAGRNRYVAAQVRIAAGRENDPAYVALCRSAGEEMAAVAPPAWAAAGASPRGGDWSTLYNALGAMVPPATRRSAVAYLAQWSGAHLCEDVALSCDDAVLGELASELSITVGDGTLDRPAVGWRMDQIALAQLARRLSAGTLPSELSAVLSDRLGEAGRHASALQEILVGLSGPDDLWQRVLATNRLYLEDSSPAARARAFEWLRQRNAQPPDFDPLAPAKLRRAALDKFARQPTTQPTAALPSGAVP